VLERIGLHRGSDVKPLPPGAQWLNRGLKIFNERSAPVEKSFDETSAGLSAICIARKPGIKSD
jgi:hypothetical protein